MSDRPGVSAGGPAAIDAVPRGWTVHPGEIRGTVLLARRSVLRMLVAGLLLLPALALDLIVGLLITFVFEDGDLPGFAGTVATFGSEPAPRRVPVVLTANQLRIGRARFDLRRIQAVATEPDALVLTLSGAARFALHGDQPRDHLAWLIARVEAARPEGTSAEIPASLRELTGRPAP